MKFQHRFPAVFSFLVREMLRHAKSVMTTLQVHKHSSFVLQTALKLLLGDDQELLHAILIILGWEEKNMAEGKFIEAERKHDIIALLEDTSLSHLFELKLIWEELGSKFEELLEIGKSGVVASSLAACQRLQIHVYKVSPPLAIAPAPPCAPARSVVRHLLLQ